ncbi:MAG: M20 family metallopeptidase [Planctomycetes bacterium]|nr:M20 family metallopeptidase [Planctomycetota bacterium]
MNALEFTSQLVSYDSVSRRSNVAVSNYVQDSLSRLGFDTERLEYDDANGVRKACIVAKKGPNTGGLAYFGHTDVVPADPWFSAEHGPFQPTVREGRLYGRGSCDMKGSIACFWAAAAQFPVESLKRPIYVTCTADEEVGYHGAREVAAKSRLFREMVAGNTPGIIGEPTRLEVVYAHKGTYGFTAIARGRAAHSSTDRGLNANLAMIPFLVEMKAIHDELQHDPAWQNAEFEPTGVSWNIGINDHTPAVNITAPQSVCTVYFRPMPGQNPDRLMDRAQAAAARCGVEFHEGPRGQPLYVDPQSPYVQTILKLAAQSTAKTVAYGTDGTMFGELKNLVVLGPGDIAQAHTHDEWIDLAELERGTALYSRLIQHFCC